MSTDVKVNTLITNGTYGEATDPKLLQAGSFATLFAHTEHTGRVVPVLLRGSKALGGGYYNRGANILNGSDTQVSAESVSAGGGTGAAQTLTHTCSNPNYVVPFSVDIYYTNPSDVAVHLYDKNGDGVLYYQDPDDDEDDVAIGTINYLTGAVSFTTAAAANFVKNGTNVDMNYIYAAALGSTTKAFENFQRTFTGIGSEDQFDLRIMAVDADAFLKVELAVFRK
jgi:hypothetical protein